MSLLTLKILLCCVLLPLYKPASACPSVCYCRLPMIDCYDRGMDEMPDDISTDAVYVNLKNNQIKSIIPERLSRLSKVESLHLSNNQIAYLQAGCLVNMTSLKQLDLNDNKISEIQPEAFKNLPQIQVLNLNNNQLQDINGVLGSMPTLERLDLSSNRLTSISNDTFSSLHALTYLSVSGNRITSISKSAFTNMTRLAYLVLSQNPLRKVDGIWKGLSTLSSLHLSSCQLDNIPSGLPSYLRLLKLSNNSLTSISANDLSKLRYLGAIYLDNNKIKTINDGALSNAPYLSHVSLSHNQLSMLPSPIPANVTSFIADNNRIRRLFQSNFDHDSAMTLLSLRNNSIEALAANTFARLTSLVSLYLDNNNIQVMYQMTYARLRKLRVLTLSSNPIREVEKRALGGLPRLTRLILSGITDRVTGFLDDMFRDVIALSNLDLQESPELVASILNNTQVLRNLRSIVYLNLMGNNLTNLDITINMWLQKLRSINLAENPWRCDADLIPLRKWMQSSPRKFTPITKVLCQYPDFLKGQPIIDVAIDQFTQTTPAPATTTQAVTVVPSTFEENTTKYQTTKEERTAHTSSDSPILPNTPNIGTTSVSSANQTSSPKSTLAPPLTAGSSEKEFQWTSVRATTIKPNGKSTRIISALTSSSTQRNDNRNTVQGWTTSVKTTQTFAIPKTTKLPKTTTARPTASLSTTISLKTSTSSYPASTSSEVDERTSQKTSATSSSTGELRTSIIVTQPKASTRIITTDSDIKSATSQSLSSQKRGSITSGTTRLPATNSIIPSVHPNSSPSASTPIIDSTSTQTGNEVNIKTTNTTTESDMAVSSQQPVATARSGESRLPAITSSRMNGKTKAIIIGVSTSLMCLIIGLLVAVVIVRHRKRQKSDPLDQGSLPSTEHHENSTDRSLIINHIHGSDVQAGRSVPFSDTDKQKNILSHENTTQDASYGSARCSTKKSRSSGRRGMNCFSPKSHDDSEMLVYSWDEPNH